MQLSCTSMPLTHAAALLPRGITGRYLNDPRFAHEFYGAHFRDEHAIRSLSDVLASRDYPRAELTAVLRRQNEEWGLSEKTAANIDILAKNALCVITGQQTGLFTGPLYTVYKGLTAIRWAEHLSNTFQTPVVPVFWLAADDHDFDEINHVDVLNADGRSVTLKCATSDNPQARVSRQHFADEIAPWLDNALAVLGTGPGRSEIECALREAYQPGRSWVDACAMLLSRWLGRYGLILVSPDDAHLKRLMLSVFRAEIAEPGASADALTQREHAIREAGYTPQVSRSGRGTLFFIDDDEGSRRRVDHDANGFVWSGVEHPLSSSALLDIFDASPDRFSANALLRPVSGDVAFPTVAHVMGPGEIAYMAQARALYERHGLPMPFVVPRAGFTVVSSDMAQALSKQHLDLEDALQSADDIISQRAADEFESRFKDSLDGCRRDIDAAYERFQSEVHAALPGISNAVTSARMKTHGLINKLTAKLRQELRRQQRASSADDIQRIADALFPHNKPQERVLSVVPHLIRYGSAWIDVLFRSIDVSSDSHIALFPE